MPRPTAKCLLALLGAAFSPAVASADDGFDSTGWVLLGEETVDRGRERDTIDVEADTSRFRKLTLAVEKDELVIDDVTIVFADDEVHVADLGHYFHDGQRALEVDLPGRARAIESITLRYGALADHDGSRDDRDRPRQRIRDHTRPVVQVWGFAAGDVRDWKDEGWDLLATKQITGRRGELALKAPADARPYDHLSLVVRGGDLRITDLTVKYRKGRRTRHPGDLSFDDSVRHHQIDLGDKPRKIRKITLAYVHRGGRSAPATLEVWGHQGPTFDTDGWTMLGQQTVEGKRDHDVVPIGRDEGRFRELAFHVIGDVAVTRIVVHMRREDLEIDVGELFATGSTWGRVDLPGDGQVIDEIDLVYSARRRDDGARIQVWAR